jgi:hypothetical protein
MIHGAGGEQKSGQQQGGQFDKFHDFSSQLSGHAEAFHDEMRQMPRLYCGPPHFQDFSASFLRKNGKDRQGGAFFAQDVLAEKGKASCGGGVRSCYL